MRTGEGLKEVDTRSNSELQTQSIRPSLEPSEEWKTMKNTEQFREMYRSNLVMNPKSTRQRSPGSALSETKNMTKKSTSIATVPSVELVPQPAS